MAHTQSSPEQIADEIAARYTAAVKARDVAAFTGLYADDVVIFDTWGRFSLTGIGAWRAAVTQWFGSLGDETVEASVRRVAANGGERLVGISGFVTFSARAASGELLRTMDSRLTWLVTEVQGAWCIVHEHSSNPLDDATLKGLMQLPAGEHQL